MELEDFEVGGRRYRITRPLNAFEQMHVLRRMAPFLNSLQAVAAAAKTAGGFGGEAGSPDLDRILKSLGPLVECVSKMPDEDIEYVCATCLTVVERANDNELGYSKVWSVSAKKPMFDDIDLQVMLTIVSRVLVGAVRPFLTGMAGTA